VMEQHMKYGGPGIRTDIDANFFLRSRFLREELKKLLTGPRISVHFPMPSERPAIMIAALRDRTADVIKPTPAAAYPLQSGDIDAVRQKLSPRETEILPYPPRGRSNREIMRLSGIGQGHLRSPCEGTFAENPGTTRFRPPSGQ
jgi:hypothetical protein